MQSRGGVCGRCVLADQLKIALDDGTGQIRPELMALFDLVVAMGRPRSGILWLSRGHIPAILGAIARGEVDLTHDAIAALPRPRTTAYIRDLLVTAGVLPPVDRWLFSFEHWLSDWLAQLPDPCHRKTLHAYATWKILRELRVSAANGPIGPYRDQISRRRIRAATRFLDDLDHDHIDLAECPQARIDAWFAHAIEADKIVLRPFLTWAINSGQMPRLRLPAWKTTPPTPITHRERMEWIGRIHNGDGMGLTERVVALLIMVYAQSLTKIRYLTLDDITVVDGAMTIRLGDPPAPVPAPFDDLISTFIAERPNLMTATNQHSTWLFPGQRAGQPMHPTTIRARLEKIGIRNLSSRTRALRAMLLEAPPAVVAGMLGYAPDKAEEIAIQAGATWKRYAPGDHTRTRVPHIGS